MIQVHMHARDGKVVMIVMGASQPAGEASCRVVENVA